MFLVLDIVLDDGEQRSPYCRDEGPLRPEHGEFLFQHGKRLPSEP